MTDVIKAALRRLLAAAKKYEAQHKVNQCHCLVCDETRAAIREAEEVLR